MLVITELERRFLIDTLSECRDSSEDLSDACEECLELLLSLRPITQEEYEGSV